MVKESNRSKGALVRSVDGILLMVRSDIQGRWREHLKNLMNPTGVEVTGDDPLFRV